MAEGMKLSLPFAFLNLEGGGQLGAIYPTRGQDPNAGAEVMLSSLSSGRRDAEGHSTAPHRA